jgi:hypothetical protein
LPRSSSTKPKAKANDAGKSVDLGWPQPARPYDQVELRFKPEAEIEHVSDIIRRDLSAAALIGRTLFVACDETATVECLTTEDWKVFDGHEPLRLASYFDLPGGPHAEMDIAGLTVADSFLWVVGSHNLTRDKPEREKQASEESLKELKSLDQDRNRYFLGRVPLVVDPDSPDLYGLGAVGAGGQTPGRHSKKPDLPGSAEETMRTAAALKMTGDGNALTKALKDDPHLGTFLEIPAKENGLDIEGIAVSGNRVALGLRGPVLRGWACILELHLKAKKDGRLKAMKLGENGERYLKHFVDLDGLGIRDLKILGDDLLILTGPTMDLDGPVGLYLWKDWLHQNRPAVLHPAKTEKLLDLPFGLGTEHPEALVPWPVSDQPAMLVVYDSPAEARLSDEGNSIKADLFHLDRLT